MKLIVGLGNPGKEYELTRHNIGFMALDHYLGNVAFKKKNNALFYEKNINDEKVIFLKPITFMNDSGSAVKYFLNYFNISIEDLLVIYDDMDFDLGNFKLRKFGSSAGHNGIKSIIANLNTEDFKRRSCIAFFFVKKRTSLLFLRIFKADNADFVPDS